jgi:hypothetical protein
MQALSPHYIFLYFIRNGYTGWYSLGGIVLAITDMSYCNLLKHPAPFSYHVSLQTALSQVCHIQALWLFTGVK